MGVHWKIGLLKGGSRKTNIEEGDCLKRGAWTVCWFKGGGLARKMGVVFLRGGGGGDTLMHTMVAQSLNLYYCKSNFTML